MFFLSGGQLSTDKLVLQFVHIFIVLFPVSAGIKERPALLINLVRGRCHFFWMWGQAFMGLDPPILSTLACLIPLYPTLPPRQNSYFSWSVRSRMHPSWTFGNLREILVLTFQELQWQNCFAWSFLLYRLMVSKIGTTQAQLQYIPNSNGFDICFALQPLLPPWLSHHRPHTKLNGPP